MNYLALCQRLRQEAGLSGTGPAAVTSQTGEAGRIVDWISAAYEDVQTLHATWRFLRTSFSFSTIGSPATQEYTPASVSITDHADWITKDMRVYDNEDDETYLEYYPWDEYRLVYMYGANRSNEGRPTVFSVKSDNSLSFWQIPNATYTIDGEYYKTAETMAANGDEPNFPARFHMILVWKGLMYYGAYAAADEKYEYGKDQYNRILTELEFDQLEDWTFGEPLA